MDEKIEEKKDSGLLDAFIVAAIDFGTTYSGYAFSFKHDYDKDPTQVDIIETALEAVNVLLSYDVASGSEITSCNKICKPLVVYRFSGNVMTSITMLRS